MAVQTDVFIASDADLTATDLLPAGPAKRFPAVQAKGMDSVKLATLAALLGDPELAEEGPDAHAFVAGLQSDFPLVRDLGAERMVPPSEGPWIFELPETMVARLAQLSRAQIARYGRTWAATEEWHQGRSVAPGVIGYLRRLCALARRARSDRKQMYLWVAL